MQSNTEQPQLPEVKSVVQPPKPDAETSPVISSVSRPEDSKALETLAEVNKLLAEGSKDVQGVAATGKTTAETQTTPSTTEETPKEQETAAEIPTITVKVGDSETSLPEDAKVSVVVDGIRQDVTLKQFLNGISGELALAKRFSAYDVNRKGLEKRLQYWNEGEKKFNEMISGGNVKQALEFILSHSQHSSDVVFQKLAGEIAPMVDKLMKMSPDQRKEWELHQKSEAYKKQLETAQTHLEKLQAKQDQLSRIRQVQQVYGLNDASFVQYHDALMEDLQAGRLPYKGEVTPEIVGEYVLMNTYQGWVQQALKQNAPHVANNGRIVMEFVKEGKRLADKGHKINQQAFMELVNYVYKGPTTKTTPPPATTKPSVQPRSNQHWLTGLQTDLSKAASPKEQQDIFRKWDNKRST